MSEVEELESAVRKLHHASKGSLPCPIPMGVRIVGFRVVAEEDAEEIIKRADKAVATITRLSEENERLFALLNEASVYVEGFGDLDRSLRTRIDAALTQGESSHETP